MRINYSTRLDNGIILHGESPPLAEKVATMPFLYKSAPIYGGSDGEAGVGGRNEVITWASKHFK